MVDNSSIGIVLGFNFYKRKLGSTKELGLGLKFLKNLDVKKIMCHAMCSSGEPHRGNVDVACCKYLIAKFFWKV